MDVPQGPRSRVVVAAVLGAVGEHRAVRSDRAGDEKIGDWDGGLVGEAVASSTRELDAAADGVECRRAVETGGLEALDGRLVAGSRRDPRPGPEVVEMELLDRGRVRQKDARRPEPIRQVVAACLELGREPAVEDDDLAARDRLARESAHPGVRFSSSARDPPALA